MRRSILAFRVINLVMGHQMLSMILWFVIWVSGLLGLAAFDARSPKPTPARPHL
jgi:hypothetical protein